jgi:hypothetical protein
MGLLYPFGRTRRKRNLASAFAGEIVAIMQVIEDHTISQGIALGQLSARERTHARFEQFHLPKFTIYEAHANDIDLFDAPLPHEISHFYACAGSLSQHLNGIDAHASDRSESRKVTQPILDEMAKTLQLGNDLLKNLQPFLSSKYK